MLDLEKIGNTISTLRKNKNMTQNDLAESLFVTHQAVSKWENGKSIPGIEILYDMTKLFDVTIDYLLDNSEIASDDYESKFKHQPRDVVIGSFIKSVDPNHEFPKIFYLLTMQERSVLLGLIVNKKVAVDVDVAWPYLTDTERKYLLGAILTGRLDYDIFILAKHLKLDELKMMESHLGIGITNHTLHIK